MTRLAPNQAPEDLHYTWPVLLVTAGGAVLLLLWFHRLPYHATPEEQIGDARARQQHHPLASTTAE